MNHCPQRRTKCWSLRIKHLFHDMLDINFLILRTYLADFVNGLLDSLTMLVPVLPVCWDPVWESPSLYRSLKNSEQQRKNYKLYYRPNNLMYGLNTALLEPIQIPILVRTVFYWTFTRCGNNFEFKTICQWYYQSSIEILNLQNKLKQSLDLRQ